MDFELKPLLEPKYERKKDWLTVVSNVAGMLLVCSSVTALILLKFTSIKDLSKEQLALYTMLGSDLCLIASLDDMRQPTWLVTGKARVGVVFSPVFAIVFTVLYLLIRFHAINQ